MLRNMAKITYKTKTLLKIAVRLFVERREL